MDVVRDGGIAKNTTGAPKPRLTTLVRERPWPLVVWVAMLGWSAGAFAIVRSEYSEFRLARFDFGNMVQAVWSTAQGRPLEITVATTGQQIERLVGHVDPILVLLAPAWIVFPTPLTLAAVQIAACALGALPVFWLGRRHLGSERAAGLLALAYLAYPWLAWTALDAIHPVTFAIPLLLYCIWFLDDDRLLPFAVCAVLAASTGELMGVSVAALGVWYAIARGKRRAGFAIAAAGFGWSLVSVYVVVPAFAEGPSVFYDYYEAVGGSPQGVIRTAFTDPGTVASAMFGDRDFRYVILLSLPLLGLFVLAPGLAAVSLPQLAASALSGSNASTDPRHHYVAGVIPFLVAASVIGVGRLSQARRELAASFALGACVAFSILFGAWPGTPSNYRIWYATDVPPERVEALRAAVDLVPSDASVSATNKVGSHLATRRYLVSVPVLGDAEWIVLDTSDPYVARHPLVVRDPPALEAFRRRIERSAEWTKVFAREGVLVFRRVPTTSSS